MSRLHLSSKSLHGVLEDREVLDEARDGLRVPKYPKEALLKVSLRCNIMSCLSRLHLSSKSLPGVLEDREIVDEAKDGVRAPKISRSKLY